MKTATIIHGWDGNPDEPMLQWIKAELEKRGFEVSVPVMPDSAEPIIDAWVNMLKETVKLSEHTFLVGHSIGCQAVLRYIETLSPDTRIEEIILIAPWMQLDMNTIEEEGKEMAEVARPWMETPIDFAKIKSQVERTVAIFSDNDRYVPLDQKQLFERELDAETIVEHSKGHFTVSEGITDLPSILEAIS